ncbi:hypothetical protein E6C27_scaffold653G00410 [Cucumis melo var. makuwa]|uniref:Uncharacterized protein n=1 Tax=Cucumis melo var. makuwa TaxID=1194695 RepID=A0A5A7SNB7_CUCMM|nr:hypothetical protein E6C27_scaffold653G00410 [Cucumis melo var. makuwa]
MHLPCDELKRSERKVNDELTFVVLNFFFDPKLFLFLKNTSKENHQANLLCSGPRTEFWDSAMKREFFEREGSQSFRLFIILAGSKYRFTPEITSFSLRPTDPLLNNWFKVQPINQNPSLTNEKVWPLVQDLDSVLKGTTYLLSQKWVEVNSILHPMSLAIHSVLPLKWEAYWASDVELPSLM